MQKIFSAIRDFGMNRPCTVLLARALRDGEPGVEATIEMRGRKLFPGARGHPFLQPQVDAHCAFR